MYKVSWIYIPLIILILITLFLIITYITARILINKTETTLSNAMVELCKNDVSLPSLQNIENFDSKLSYNKNNSYAFLIINKYISAWSGCGNSLPNISNFEKKYELKAFDTKANLLRNICVVYYSVNLNMVIISFSGTRYVSEWYDDFDYEQIEPVFIKNQGVLIHKGHYNLYNSLRTELLSDLQIIVNDKTICVCTGHSLGGSLASICFADLIYNKIFNNITLYSFAAPRSGNIEFVKIINDSNSSYRIVNSEDIIPQLVLPIMGCNIYYEHYGKELPFTLNLKNYSNNHVQAYQEYLKNQI